MSNTIKINSLPLTNTAKECVSQLRREYEMLIMFQLARPILKRLKTNSGFSSPTKSPTISPKTSLSFERDLYSSAHLSTRESSDISDQEEEDSKPKNALFSN